MSKALANKLLRELGLANIKMKTGEYGKEKTYRNSDGKLVKAIKYADAGPLDCFMNIGGRRAVMFDKIADKFRKEGFDTFDRSETNLTITIVENKKKLTVLTFWQNHVATYTRDANLDPQYRSHYLIPEYHTESKLPNPDIIQ